MANDNVKLEKIDYDILRYISQKQQVSWVDLLTEFRKYNATINYRLDVLMNRDKYIYRDPQMGYLFESIDPCYKLTTLGYTILQNYIEAQKEVTKTTVFKWVRYVITTLIAVAALIISIISIRTQHKEQPTTTQPILPEESTSSPYAPTDYQLD